MNENTAVLRVIASYALAVCAFWMLFWLNSTRHWISSRHFIAAALCIGLAMCIGSVLVPMLRSRAN
ncbi:MAG: hypothetical protein ABSE43_02465 [Steroidobacteraceae bacterium]|jgi:hypothetical protein